MDEWPELEALAQALDAWDEWPEAIDPSAARVIDAVRPVVANYRETKAVIAMYKAMPVPSMSELRMQGLMTEEQYRRQVGLPAKRKGAGGDRPRDD